MNAIRWSPPPWTMIVLVSSWVTEPFLFAMWNLRKIFRNLYFSRFLRNILRIFSQKMFSSTMVIVEFRNFEFLLISKLIWRMTMFYFLVRLWWQSFACTHDDLPTGWPVKHGRIFRVTCKMLLVGYVHAKTGQVTLYKVPETHGWSPCSC